MLIMYLDAFDVCYLHVLVVLTVDHRWSQNCAKNHQRGMLHDFSM